MLSLLFALLWLLLPVRPAWATDSTATSFFVRSLNCIASFCLFGQEQNAKMSESNGFYLSLYGQGNCSGRSAPALDGSPNNMQLPICPLVRWLCLQPNSTLRFKHNTTVVAVSRWAMEPTPPKPRADNLFFTQLSSLFDVGCKYVNFQGRVMQIRLEGDLCLNPGERI